MPHKALSFGANGQAKSIAKGIYIDEVRIIAARDVSGKKPSQFLHSLKNVPADSLTDKSKTPVDLGIEVKLDVGRDFEPVMSFYGWFKREGNTIKDWGSAFKVRGLFDAVHVKGDLDSANRIPPAQIKELVGQKFLRLTYVRGTRKGDDGKMKPAYNTWDEVGPINEKDPDAGKQALLEKFQKSLKRGYPKNFKPDALDELSAQDATFTAPNAGATTVAESAKSQESDW